MRRNELLGLRWEDFDEDAATVSVNRGLVVVDYELRETRGKTANARRCIDLDPSTVDVMSAGRGWQAAEQRAAGVESRGWMFTDPDGDPIHPTRSRSASNASPDEPVCALSACTTSDTLAAPC
jgi:integrase